ncbi:MAG: sulfur carrier protein ThiS [Deltaproteobacteria bacterium]
MKITLNGEPKELQDGHTVTALLEELGIQKDRVAVELNLDIVPKRRFADTVLKDEDRIEIVSFVGGG